MRTAPFLLAPLTVLALVGCGADTTDESSAPAATSTSTSASAPSASTPSASTPGAGSAPTSVDRPAPDTCTDLTEAADGVYAVADAGTVTMTRDGDRLVLGEVRPADGWETESVEEERDEIEIEFRGDGIELDFEAELDGGGRLDVEICRDDD